MFVLESIFKTTLRNVQNPPLLGGTLALVSDPEHLNPVICKEFSSCLILFCFHGFMLRYLSCRGGSRIVQTGSPPQRGCQPMYMSKLEKIRHSFVCIKTCSFILVDETLATQMNIFQLFHQKIKRYVQMQCKSKRDLVA